MANQSSDADFQNILRLIEVRDLCLPAGERFRNRAQRSTHGCIRVSSRKLELDVREILDLYGKGQADAGLNKAKIIFRLAPNLAITNYCVGHGLAVTGQASVALPFLQKAVKMAPQNADYALRLGLTQLEAGDFRAAETTLLKVRDINPKLVNGQWALGIFYASIDRFDKAAGLLKQVIEADLPASLAVGARLDWCRALVANGQVEEARKTLKDLARIPAVRVKALARLASIEPFALDSPEFAEIEYELAQSRLEGLSLYQLLAAKAKCLGAAKDYEQEYTVLGQSKLARGSNFNLRETEVLVDTAINQFSNGALERMRKLLGESDFRPIFIVGMPRSGTTLTERILSRHSDVGAAGETSLLPDFISKCLGENPRERLLDVIEKRGPLPVRQLARAVEETMRFLSPGKDRITDKLPSNFFLVGWIFTLFPESRVIHCYRDPADNMLSGFKATLTSGHAYFDRPDWFVAYYKQYAKLMKFWHNLFPGRIHALCYEELVTQPEEAIRTLLSYCDLPWQEDCLYPEDNPSRILTASVLQARAPINAKSVGGWKRYARHLQTVHDQLVGISPLPDRSGTI